MFWRVEIREKEGFYDAVGESVKRDVIDLGFRKKVQNIKAVGVYLVEGDINESDIKFICENLMIDPVTQEYNYNKDAFDQTRFKVVEVAYNPGVMDPVEESAKKAIRDLNI